MRLLRLPVVTLQHSNRKQLLPLNVIDNKGLPLLKNKGQAWPMCMVGHTERLKYQRGPR
jgi:hypothetical protein